MGSVSSMTKVAPPESNEARSISASSAAPLVVLIRTSSYSTAPTDSVAETLLFQRQDDANREDVLFAPPRDIHAGAAGVSAEWAAAQALTTTQPRGVPTAAPVIWILAPSVRVVTVST